MQESSEKKELCRCKWCNLKNIKYVEYHDKEWGIPQYEDDCLFELLILESFQAGLSWECVLNKRDSFREAFDQFDLNTVCNYDEKKIEELMENKNIIRNRRKICAAIDNAKVFRMIKNEYHSFSNYIWHFTNFKIIYERDRSSSDLSDRISEDLKHRGMKFVGTTIIYAYLQAIGVIYSHDEECFIYREYEK